MARVYIETYGCTLNQADSDILAAILIKSGHEIAGSECDSDVVVLNTCTVKGATENKIFERIRKLGTQNPKPGSSSPKPKTLNPKLVIAGCLSANIKKIRKYCPGAPILTPSSLSHINAAIEDALAGKATLYSSKDGKEGLPKLLTAPICRIPISDGCVSSCAFCQTKLARPYLRSLTPKTVVGWINDAVRGGAREIQLASQDSGAYGLDIRTGLIRLLEAIAEDDSSKKAEDEFLVRLGMINPDHAKRMLADIIRLMKGPRFYKFLHVPVQTGSEKVCKEMGRDHSVRDFADIVTAVRDAIPEAMISTDIIVGYPTETEEDFQETLSLLQNTKPETVNLSKFSARPGTRAKEMEQLPNLEIKRRSEEAAALIRGVSGKARNRFIGRAMRVLITEKGKNGKDFKGRAINYHQVVVRKYNGRLGDFVDVEICDANHGSLFGEIVR